MRKKYKFVCLILSLCFILINPLKVLAAYSNSYYYSKQNLKVGLETMMASSIKIYLNGEYIINGETLGSGTVCSLILSNGKIVFNSNEFDHLLFEPIKSDTTLSIEAGSIKRTYKGKVDFQISGERILPVNTVNIEDYVEGVIGYEMSDSYEIEALKAQAVAARSYALARSRHGSSYNVCDWVDCQVYKGYNSAFVRVPVAVEETKGQVIVSSNYLVEALYSACNGGYTEDSANVWGNAYSYYKANKDAFDDYRNYSNSKSYDRTTTFTTAEIDTKLRSTMALQPQYKFLRINLNTIRYYPSGRVSYIELVCRDVNTGQEVIFTRERDKARSYLGLRSSMYTVTYDPSQDKYSFYTHGYGHGLGMSQIGALNRARGGQKYNEIISFYYNGTGIVSSLANIKSLGIDKQNVYSGDNVTFNAVGQGGSGSGYLYKYVIQKDGQVVYEGDYSSSQSLPYSFEVTGDYNAMLFLKDVQSKDDFDDKRTVNFRVYGLGDINDDKTVDIFDLTLISKRYGQVKGNSSEWNDRVDIFNDGVIDINDLAGAAKNYNLSYK